MKVILFSGLPGTGKTTLISDLFAKNHIKVISNDAIRKKMSIDDIYTKEISDICYTYTLGEIFKSRNDCKLIAVDAVYAHEYLYKNIKELSELLNFELLTITCEASWKSIHKRIRERICGNFSGMSYAHWNIVKKLRNEWKSSLVKKRNNQICFNSNYNLFYSHSVKYSQPSFLPVILYKPFEKTNLSSIPSFLEKEIQKITKHILNRIKKHNSYALYIVGSLAYDSFSYTFFDNKLLLFSDIDYLLIIDEFSDDIIELQKDLVEMRKNVIGSTNGFHIGLKTRTIDEVRSMGPVESSAFNTHKLEIQSKGKLENFIGKVFSIADIKNDLWKYLIHSLHCYILYSVFFYGVNKKENMRCLYFKAKTFIILYNILHFFKLIENQKSKIKYVYKRSFVIAQKIKNNKLKCDKDYFQSSFSCMINDLLDIGVTYKGKLSIIEKEYFNLCLSNNLGEIPSYNKSNIINILRSRFSVSYSEYRDHIDLYSELLSVNKTELSPFEDVCYEL